MNGLFSELIEAARTVCGEFRLREDFSAGDVAAALRTDQGNIYTGICVDLSCGLGFCAEIAAVAEMLKHRETRITAIVAIGADTIPVEPCGRCREMMVQIDERNMDCKILLRNGVETTLRALLPHHWLDQGRDRG